MFLRTIETVFKGGTAVSAEEKGAAFAAPITHP